MERWLETIKALAAGFTSLSDSAVAVDLTTGVTDVVDNLQPVFTEKPQAQIYAFSSAGNFLGVRKYKIVDALPAGLAGGGAEGSVSSAVQGPTDECSDCGAQSRSIAPTLTPSSQPLAAPCHRASSRRLSRSGKAGKCNRRRQGQGYGFVSPGHPALKAFSKARKRVATRLAPEER